MDRGDRGTIEGGIELAPLACRHRRSGGQIHGLEYASYAYRVDREDLAEQSHRRLAAAAFTRLLHRTTLGLGPGVPEHRPGQHIFGLGMGGHAEPRHVYADDTHPVDLFWQQIERDAGRGRHTQIDHHDGIVLLRIGELEDRLADVLEQLPGDQGLGVEGHIADRAARSVEVRRERQAIDAAGRAAQHRRRAPHAQADAQRTECRAHALRLIMRTRRVVGRVALEHFALAGGCRGAAHLVGAGMTAGRAITDDRSC